MTVDFHKTFFLPVAASALLLRDGAGFRHSAVHADYLNPADDPGHAGGATAVKPTGGGPAVDKSLQTTRRFDALKLWMTLRVLGADGIGRLLAASIDSALRIANCIEQDPELELVRRPQLSTVLFRPHPRVDVLLEPCSRDAARSGPCPTGAELADRLVRPVRDALFAEGHSLVAATVVDGRPCLKLTVLDPNLTDVDVGLVLADVRAAAGRLAAGLRSTTTEVFT